MACPYHALSHYASQMQDICASQGFAALFLLRWESEVWAEPWLLDRWWCYPTTVCCEFSTQKENR